jgi:hypothetical protein
MLPSKVPVRIPIGVLLARKSYDKMIYNTKALVVENGPPFLIEEKTADDNALVLVRIHGDTHDVRYELPGNSGQLDFPQDGTNVAGVLPLASAYISHIVYDKHVPYETKLILLEKGAEFMVRRADSTSEHDSERRILWTGSELLVRTALDMNGCVRRG